MRDPTRGGLSGALNERAAAPRVGVELDEAAIPVRREVHAACEGMLIAVVPMEDTARAPEAMRAHPLGRNAALVGEVVGKHPGLVVVKSLVGGERVVTMLAGEQLPRIC